ncbi:hypothetical protein M6B38_190110 [Iris pallida]|uniref:Uncharacterized protein n=1 Tax=Iris pallida TaxID=29817 RepID=A0AAX6EFY2_IRIPA|nr:hypothetical protein M6B38_190110 [Iris pallida]
MASWRSVGIDKSGRSGGDPTTGTRFGPPVMWLSLGVVRSFGVAGGGVVVPGGECVTDLDSGRLTARW